MTKKMEWRELAIRDEKLKERLNDFQKAREDRIKEGRMDSVAWIDSVIKRTLKEIEDNDKALHPWKYK